MKINRLLGATALVGSLFVVPAAFAQAAPNVPNPTQSTERTQETVEAEADARLSADGEEGDVNEVVVTGSRIPRPETSGVLPGVQVDSVQIQARGFTNALEVLNDIPLVGPGSSPLTGNNGGQSASLGSAFVDLLDLGTARTLTLVNGRRFVSGNAGSLFVDGNASGSQVDVNVIPAGLISRVDVLTVGGAAAYGSDAIAGVVNYILRDDYEGSEVTGLAGISERGDAAQYTARVLAGRNFMDDRANLTLAAEYNRNDGLLGRDRDFRLRRATTIGNFANGGIRNGSFAPNAIIDVTGTNNGAFLRNTDDLQPANLFGEGFNNLSISLAGTILNTLATPPTPYVPLAGTGAQANRVSNYITFQNGLGTTTGQIVPTPRGNITLPNTTFFTTGTQLVNGLPGAPSSLILNDGRNGIPSTQLQPANLPFTTFAPTVLPANVTAAQVFTGFGVTPPAGATATQLNTLAVNVLQANRPTAREFLAANPGVGINAFIGTFIPGVPRVQNTNTTPVTVRNGNGTTTTVAQNVVLPFLAVPIEFTPEGSVRQFTAAQLDAGTPSLLTQALGSNGGFTQGPDTVILRTQQDRYVANLLGKFDLTDEVTFFTENLFARVKNVGTGNQASNNSVSASAENAALVLNVNNPFLDAGDRAALASAGINANTRGGSFALTRINQDIFEGNAFSNVAETYRLVGGVRSNFELLGQRWNAELSATYGRSKQTTKTTTIGDLEYQLALDAVDQGVATTGVANGNVVCRSQLFRDQYVGRTPNGTVSNITRLDGAGGIPTETVVTPTITNDLIDRCRPLNPFGYNQMSEDSKNYVRQDATFSNVSAQTFLQASVSGTLFDLPGGPLGVSAAGEYRKEELSFQANLINRLGRGRTAPSGTTNGFIEVYEIGGEARIPIFGNGFVDFLGELTFEPAVRVSQQSGRGQTFRNLAGVVSTPEYQGDPATIYTLAGTWRPIPDILFRGNYTKSIRQPGVVELFLGGQPAFAVTTDVCGTANINGGTSAATRRANCRSSVIAAGLATDASTADAFLSTFVANNISLPTQFSGGTGLSPERAKSYTFGGVLAPRFVPGLSLSADYIAVDLREAITVLTPSSSVQFCLDSPTFPDTAAQVGSNLCEFFSRGSDFQILPGSSGTYLNLSAIEVRAITGALRYNFDLPADLGNFTLRGSLYHLIRFDTSFSGDFAVDGQKSAGTFDRPKWEAQASGRYEKDGFFSQLTWNWKDRTKLFTNGAPSTIEQFPNVVFPRYSVFDFVIGADVNERFRMQFNVFNLTDKNYAGDIGLSSGLFTPGFVDQIGRRFQVTTNIKF
ncbi:TonB-dependent receptor domain-containing protein [uncultured Sphingomonas sp.]|uniref:TonB-dependent receptor domain-containing protein n=1 Tax=uncultured Sphingomonas sp. TaxID=158754 RepID=UPI0035CACA0F